MTFLRSLPRIKARATLVLGSDVTYLAENRGGGAIYDVGFALWKSTTIPRQREELSNGRFSGDGQF